MGWTAREKIRQKEKRQKEMKILSKIKSLFRKGTNTGISFSNALPSSGLDDTFLFDFKNYQSQYTGVAMNSFISVGGASDSDSEESSKETSRKIAVKPKDVLNELETIPTPWTLSNLDDKIEVLKYKSDLITQNYSKREVQGLIERLENRKQWHKYKNFFQEFQNTTDEKIDALLDNYDLVMKTSDLFIPEFPDDAIAVMKKYTDNMQKLCKKKPVFYVIAEPDKFKKAYEKRDPILLVQSPFGFYWQILGAWDEEMVLLSEL
jgi:hypothetical protein